MGNYIGSLISAKRRLRLLCEPDFNIIVKITDATVLGVAMTILESDFNHYKVGAKIFFSLGENFSFEEVSA